MGKKGKLKYYNILEIGKKATQEEIERAYRALIKLYTDESIVTMPIDDEMTQKEKEEICKNIEEAYANLSDSSAKIIDEIKPEPAKEEIKTAPSEEESLPVKLEIHLDENIIEMQEDSLDPLSGNIVVEQEMIEVVEPDFSERDTINEVGREDPKPLDEEPERLEPEPAPIEIKLDQVTIERQEEGKVEIDLNSKLSEAESIEEPADFPVSFKEEREKQGLRVHDISITTGIPYKIIANIEQEKFHKLPEGGYLRWNIVSYAKALNLDSKIVADQFMKKYRAWKLKN